jgi:hypothetical protein
MNVLVRNEMMFTQLIFRHVLRVRLGTASPEKEKLTEADDTTSATVTEVGTGATTPALSEGGESLIDGGEGEASTAASASELASGSTAIQPSIFLAPPSPTKSKTSQPDKGKDKEAQKEKDATKTKKKNANVGAVVNLVTVDVNSLNDGFEMTGSEFISSILCFIQRTTDWNVRRIVKTIIRVLVTFALLYTILGWRYVLSTLPSSRVAKLMTRL